MIPTIIMKPAVFFTSMKDTIINSKTQKSWSCIRFESIQVLWHLQLFSCRQKLPHGSTMTHTISLNGFGPERYHSSWIETISRCVEMIHLTETFFLRFSLGFYFIFLCFALRSNLDIRSGEVSPPELGR